MHTWLNASELTLNMTKTAFMLIGSGERLNTIAAFLSILMDGTRLKQVAATKLLGIPIDDKLSWNLKTQRRSLL